MRKYGSEHADQHRPCHAGKALATDPGLDLEARLCLRLMAAECIATDDPRLKEK